MEIATVAFTAFLVLLTQHARIAGAQWYPTFARLRARLDEWASRKKPAGKPPGEPRLHPLFKRKLQLAREQHFVKVSEWAWNMAGILMFIVISGEITSSGLKVATSPQNDPLAQMLTVGVTLYACLFANYKMQHRAVHMRAFIFYGANIFVVIGRQMSCDADPYFFLLHPMDMLYRVLVSAGILDIRLTVLGEIACFVSSVVNYERNIVSFHMEKILPEQAPMWVLWNFNYSLIICGIAYFAERWFKQITMLQMEAEDAQESLQRILSAMCDTVLHLDSNLCIRKPPPNLLHMLSPGCTEAAQLDGRAFAEFIAEETEKSTFSSFTTVPAPGDQNSLMPRPAASMHLHLQDTRGHSFRAQLFHTMALQSASSSLVHILGIRYHEDKDDRPAEDMSAADIEDEAVPELPSMPLPVRQHVGSAAGGVSALSMSVRSWRCPRCQATGRDWGDAESVGPSVAESYDSFNIPATGLPREPAPPAAEHLDESTLDAHLDALHEWVPEVCEEVLGGMAETHDLLCASAASLEETSMEQHAAEQESQLLALLLVGARMELTWHGLRPCWLQVIQMVMSAKPITLRSLDHSPTGGKLVVAWLLPEFTGGLEYPLPDIWDTDPQQVYKKFRKEVLAHTNRLARRAARSARARGLRPLFPRSLVVGEAEALLEGQG